MEKKLIEETVWHHEDYKKPIPFSKIKDIVEDDDTIIAGWVEGFYTENNSCDGHFSVEISRTRVETDEEFEERKKESERDKKYFKDRRYKNYLKLKEEFGD